ncbi:heat shock protein 70 [Linnemannia elongata AG-77]|uniref:Heat shock protein 70 n=1 Tax=Linnemannia elongata AG-77 TaxID=1314771 RepID=A0A197K483_9FUNG|nr:heat shock protein 70 [Linnemannia elongata AG-77]
MSSGKGDNVAIGIDLGTAYSKVAIWKHDHVEIIRDERGNHVHPSIVAFSDTECIIGQEAQDQLARNFPNSIFDTKRIIGRRFDDKIVQSSIPRWPFAVFRKDGKSYYQVLHKGEFKELTPQENAAFIISQLRHTAETYLGTTVTNAVISVPASFTDAQRQAIKDAGIIAGLSITRIIKEPSAAALAFALNKKITHQKRVLIIDLGASVTDVTLCTIEDDVIDVLATAGNAHLGGRNFEDRLVDDLAQEFKRCSRQDISSDVRALNRLRIVCERTKRTLSTSTETTIDIGSLAADIDFSTTVTRARFEALNKDLFESILEPVRKVLNDAKEEKNSIDEVVLVGGSSRIPKIRQLVSEFFGGKELNTALDANEAVVIGAAFLGAMLTSSVAPKFGELLLVEATSLTIGTEGPNGEMVPIIRHNVSIPIKRMEVFSTSKDNQFKVSIPIYEGESPKARENNILGMLDIAGIPSAPREHPLLKVDFNIDSNGILDVFEGFKFDESTLRVTINKGGLSKKEVERMAKEVKAYRDEDRLKSFRNGLDSNIADLSIGTSFD